MIKLYLQCFDGIIINKIEKNDSRNVFSRGYEDCTEGNTDYYVYEVEAGNFTPEKIICFSEEQHDLNTSISGVYCQTINDNVSSTGVIIPSSLRGLPEEISTAIEHVSLLLNDELTHTDEDYHSNNYSPTNKPDDIINKTNILYSTIDNKYKGVFVKSQFMSHSSAYKTDRFSIDLSKICGEIEPLLITRKTDLHYMNSIMDIWILLYRGSRNQDFVHFIPLAYGFADWYGALSDTYRSIFTDFVNSTAFRVTGRILQHNRELTKNLPTLKDVVVRGIILAIEGRRPYIKTMLLHNDDNDKYINIPIKDNTNLTNGLFSLAKIHITDTGRMKCKLYDPQFSPNPRKSKFIHDEEQDNKELFFIRDNEAVYPIMENSNSHPDYLSSEILNGRIGVLQYDILQAISQFQYLTNHMIFKLLDCEYLPYYKNELSPTQTEVLQTILSETNSKLCQSQEGDEIYEFEHKVVNSQKLQDITQKLCKMDFLGRLEFKQPSGKASLTKVFYLKKSGSNLLYALHRKNIKLDAFAFARPVFDIKSILSANQLCTAYICALNKKYHITLDKKIPTCYLTTENKAVRVYFKLTLNSINNTDPDMGIVIVGESIRNTSGLSKEYGELCIEEKWPRLLSIANETSEALKQHTFLTLVFPSYDEMTNRAPFIWNVLSTLGKSEYLHLHLTYDMLTLAPFEGLHFAFNDDGVLKRTGNMIDLVDSLMISPPSVD